MRDIRPPHLYAVTVMLLFLACGSAGASITGSAHDFSSEIFVPESEICLVCHAPHNAQEGIVTWSHEGSGATYEVYSSPSVDAGGGVIGEPSGASKLCLSCHDGTVAVDSFGGGTGTTFVTGAALIGTDLSRDHPISFAYDDTLVTDDGELADPSSTIMAGSRTVAEYLEGGTQLQCSTCHDVHQSDPGVSTKLLRVSLADGALCLRCHVK